MKTRLLIIIGIITLVAISSGVVMWLEYGVVCNKAVLDHLQKYSNLFDENFDGKFAILDIGYPFGVHDLNIQECVQHVLEKRISIKLEPEPELFSLNVGGASYSDFQDAASERLSWITFPSYLPDGISFLGIQKQELGLAYAVFGNSETVGLDGTLQDNIRTGIVVIFFVEGIVSEYEDWDETAQNRAKESPLHSVSKKDNITVLLADGPDDDSVFYRDGRYTINVISNLFDSHELEKIIRSMLIDNKGVLQTELTPEDFGETIVDHFEITLTKNYIEVVEGGEFEHIQVLLWSKDKQDKGKIISVIPNNWRVGVVEDSEEKIKNWLNHDDPTLPSGVDASFFSDGRNMYIEVRNYPSMSIPLGEYNLRAIWSSHQTQEWDSVPFTIVLKSGN